MEYYIEATLVCSWCELRKDYRHFRTDRIKSARVLEASLSTGVAVERLLVMGTAGHRLLQRGELGLDGDQLGCAGEDVVAQGQGAIAGRPLIVQGDLGPLGEDQLAEVNRRLPGEHPQQRRLPRAVAPGDGHALAALELERDAAQQGLAGHVLGEI